MSDFSQLISLRGMHLKFHEEEDVIHINDWIVACLILHNILKSFDDSWEDEEVENVDGNDEQARAGMTNRTGEDFRNNLRDRVLCDAGFR